MRKPRAPRPQSSPGEEDPLPPSVPPGSTGGRRGARDGRGAPAQGRTAPPTRGGRPRRSAGRGVSGSASGGSPGGARTGASAGAPGGGTGQSGSSAPSPASPQSATGDQEHGEQRSSELTVFSRRPAIELRREGREDRVVSTGLADRLAERRRALMRLRMRQVVAVLAVVAVAVALGWGLLFSPLLALRTTSIQVTGSDGSVSDSQVREILSPYQGRSLLRLDMAELSEQVGGDLVRVRSAQVTRDWPRGLSVNLEMRVPVAVRHTDSGVEVLDNEAVVLEVASTAPQGLVTIVADAHSAQDAASGGDLSAEQVSAVARVVGALDGPVLARVASGSATATGQVTLTLTDGATVVWGQSDGEDNARKAKVLAVLLQTPAAVYDVSSKSPTTSQTPLHQTPGQQDAQESAPAPAQEEGAPAPEGATDAAPQSAAEPAPEAEPGAGGEPGAPGGPSGPEASTDAPDPAAPQAPEGQ